MDSHEMQRCLPRERLLSNVYRPRFGTACGYTLMEVVLALTLLLVLMSFIGAAMDSHLRILDANRMQVAEAQLARTVLEKIARDIRSTVVAIKEETLTVDDTASGLLTGDMSLLMGDVSGTDTTGTEEESTSETLEMPAEGTVVGVLPGIYGDIDWIQIDTARIPRGESYGSKKTFAEGSTMWDRLSPSKTVLYYLGADTGTLMEDDLPPEMMTNSLGGLTDMTAPRYGLFRRQLDRNVAQYALDAGLDSMYEQQDEPLAPEIDNIEFSYYDSENQEWVSSWDMDTAAKLPAAVRIYVVVRRPKVRGGTVSTLLSGTTTSDGVKTVLYSETVVLPITFTKTPTTEEDTSSTNN